MEKSMPRKSAEREPQDSKAKDQPHKPAKHIEETARLASSVESDKNPKKIRSAKDEFGANE
jgi:hypothetical protein